jgi:hypothetical protein
MMRVGIRKDSSNVQPRALKLIKKKFDETYSAFIDDLPDEVLKAREFISTWTETIWWLEERIKRTKHVASSPDLRRFEKQLSKALRELDHFVCRYESLTWDVENLNALRGKHLAASKAIKKKWRSLEARVATEKEPTFDTAHSNSDKMRLASSDR